MNDPVNHPAHYTSHPSGVECITVARHLGFNLGNVLKYIWRADLKADALEDLRKARFYLDDEIRRRELAEAITTAPPWHADRVVRWREGIVGEHGPEPLAMTNPGYVTPAQ